MRNEEREQEMNANQGLSWQQTWALKANLSSQTHVFALSFGTLISRHDIKIENSHWISDFKQNTSLNSACY